ncbi:MAG: hypothetical protein JM58_01110 [Peptococcaceae bacterium BICA1-8]|nr:MAG: hypothetical protein JM58_01110 [Peptococcaceae bacterium BICA1-8]
MENQPILNSQGALKTESETRWAGFTTKWYVISFGLFLIASYLKVLPGGWLGAYAFATLLGVLLEKVGDNTPIIKDYFGGGAIVMIFGGAALVYFNLLPEQTVKSLTSLAKSMDYLGWVVGGLICGSILGMDRNLLIRAGALYFVPIFAGVAASFGVVFIAGEIFGYGGAKAIMFIALPIMAGGTAAGAVPTSQIYASALGGDPGHYLSLIMPAVALGNALAIVSGGLLNKLGNKYPSLAGNGDLLVGYKAETKGVDKIDIQKLGVGFILTGVFFALGKILASFIPLHYYALTIIAVAVVKILNILPEEIVDAAKQWYEFIVKLTIPAILILIGTVYTDLRVVIEALSWQYVLLALLTLIGAIIGTGFVGRLVGFFFVESAVTAGLCMANMGGSGDIATLAAAKRMHLMPFAQISSRIGGAVMLVIGSVLVSFLGAFM